MEVEKRNDGKLAVLRPAGSLNAAVVDRVREEWFGWLKNEPEVRTVVVNLAYVDFMDSSGMGLLISMLKHLGERDGEVRLAALRKGVRMVFEITRTYKVFDIYDSVEEAVGSAP